MKLRETTDNKPIQGFIFTCSDKTESECFERSLFGTDRIYGPVVIRIRKDDLLFLVNIDTDTLYGVFKAVSDGGFKIVPEAWEGRYPYQVKVKILGEVIEIPQAKKILKKFKVRRNTPLYRKKLLDFLNLFVLNMTLLNNLNEKGNETIHLILEEEKVKKHINERYIEEEIPIIESTTFWDFPRQSYGLTPKGDNKYPGVTPALIIYNMVWRYTDPGDLVVDPMAGSGTTLDVCREERRRCICYEIAPTRPDVVKNDARNIPLEDNSVDMIFIDSPYGDNIEYNDNPDCIGKISCEDEKFYDELEKVMKECYRILKPGKVLGWLIGDQWVKKRFTPVGFKIYDRLRKYFEPVDIICVARRGQASHTDVWHNRARRFNFFLRGFKYLIIVRKPTKEKKDRKPRKISWTYYERKRIAYTRGGYYESIIKFNINSFCIDYISLFSRKAGTEWVYKWDLDYAEYPFTRFFI
ncbi:MAG: methyltransferase domain-containing protein [Candidatus Marinimicrobia bacterium]|nr:methyltransferase domain-containing protein [Candidatus Neomarinimicrobiota bacterium]